MQVHLTLKSANRKVGAIPVSTTSAQSCPKACPLNGNGCYAQSGPLALHWGAVTRKERGTSWGAFCKMIDALPSGQLWRHNQAGDLPGARDRIDARKLGALVAANSGRRGFTYTHYPVESDAGNRDAVRAANAAGFTINLSADTARDADRLAALNVAPVVCIMPRGGDGKTSTTPQGRMIVRCPAEYRETSCAECGMCAIADRTFVVGFTVHGSGAKRADVIARG